MSEPVATSGQPVEQKNWNQLTTDEKLERMRKRVKALEQGLNDVNNRFWNFKDEVKAEQGECYF